jgi:hypothetical protein
MEAFKERMRQKKKRQAAPVVPQNKVDRVVALMLRRFNHLTENMNDSQRMVTARILANDLSQIDTDRGPQGGAAMRRLGD